MTHILSQFETFHGGPLHAVSFDLYGTKVATASSDESIRLWDVSAANAGAQFLQELRGHSGPVWQVCWAHPRFGSVLGSCGYDRRIVVWQQQSGAQAFVPVYSNDEHGASVNALAFAPEAAGLILAAGSSDGCISVLTHQEGDLQQWSRQVFSAHFNGVLAVAWAPIGAPGASGGNSRMESLLMASGGGDNNVRLWSLDASQQWTELPPMEGEGHSDWVRDIAFRPQGASSFVLPGALLLASCSEDKTVKLWLGEPPSQQLQEQQDSQQLVTPAPSQYKWHLLQTLVLDAPAWRLSWSQSGALLAVACGNSAVLLLKENVHGTWELVADLAESNVETEKQQQQQQVPPPQDMQQQKQMPPPSPLQPPLPQQQQQHQQMPPPSPLQPPLPQQQQQHQQMPPPSLQPPLPQQ
ncbi:protein transport protein SEC13, partial [Cyclospora cayetanensis]|uniref:Protein transport protein SEC13 n=1 Tax=Cyclospora cayetanensis TaxID=88456 RepID=A0A6P6RXB1_9EIME